MQDPWGEEQSRHVKRERVAARELRHSHWWKMRIAVGLCYYCQKKVPREALTMDHIVPVSRGGRSNKGNVVPACKDCNNHKKNLTAAELALKHTAVLHDVGRDCEKDDELNPA